MCNDPAPNAGGRQCLLTNQNGARGNNEEQIRICNIMSCPIAIHGNWGQWSFYTTCSKSCGSGKQSRYRLCNNPSASNKGLECLIPNTNERRKKEQQSRNCNTNSCPVSINGDWGQWSYFTSCSKSCGKGEQSRYRLCNSPSPAYKGLECLISNTNLRGKKETQNGYCNTNACPVSINGNWGQWSFYTSCSKSCGRGQQSRYRLCNNPSASNKGLECLISNTNERGKKEEQIRKCNTNSCPISINGNWGRWSFYTTCSKSCGKGQQSRYRLCNNPSASNKGQECLISNTFLRGKKETQNRNCNTNSCPVSINGNWGQWSVFTSCSKSCGRGLQSRNRICNNPSASNGGLECMLTTSSNRARSENQERYCNAHRCPSPIHGEWGQWSHYTSCSQTCGEGVRSRYRLCNNPEASDGGRQCMLSHGDFRYIIYLQSFFILSL